MILLLGQLSGEDRARGFAIWLRTGRLPVPRRADGVELKFNPWHGPEDGRFTFKGTGKYFGRDNFKAGGGVGFGGGGTTGGWRPDKPTKTAHRRGSGHSSGQLARSASEQRRTIVRNGYTYELDIDSRTRRVAGLLTVATAPSRSRKTQIGAGGGDRRSSDDGGHYIAARFNGPTEAFNHFAQDARFNRGRYRLLEDQWAQAKRQGRSVAVTIIPEYEGASKRPSVINVRFAVDGQRQSQRFLNERGEKKNGK